MAAAARVGVALWRAVSSWRLEWCPCRYWAVAAQARPPEAAPVPAQDPVQVSAAEPAPVAGVGAAVVAPKQGLAVAVAAEVVARARPDPPQAAEAAHAPAVGEEEEVVAAAE